MKGSQRVVRAKRVRAMHQTREHLRHLLAAPLAFAKPGLRHERDQRGHRETEAPLFGIDRLRHDRGRDFGRHCLHALTAQHEHAFELTRGNLVERFVERRGAGGRGGFAADRRDPRQPKVIGHRGHVTDSQLLAVHDDLHGVERADRRTLMRSGMPRRRGRRSTEDASREIDLREADARDVDLFCQRPRILYHPPLPTRTGGNAWAGCA